MPDALTGAAWVSGGGGGGADHQHAARGGASLFLSLSLFFCSALAAVLFLFLYCNALRNKRATRARGRAGCVTGARGGRGWAWWRSGGGGHKESRRP